ncbi:MAG: hypothetical protein H7A45_13815 [Verrucomicrobiales bacterium]|nr:hypothetical protein [Verrucomicrobiales bacterium]
MTRRNDLENLMKSLIGRLFPKRIARTWAAVLWAATPFWSALPQTPATAAFVEQPAARRAVAWIRFVDAPERYAGTPYYWLGNGDLRLAFSVRPESGQALELHWGAKQDHRQATLVVNGRPLPVEGGGHDGFRWLRVPLPGDLPGDRIELTLRASGGLPAFLAEARLTGAGEDRGPSPAEQIAFRAEVLAKPETYRAPDGPVFPEQAREVWQREPVVRPAGLAEIPATLFAAAEANSRLANEGFYRARRFIDGWLAHADAVTGLIPRNLNQSRDFWNGRDSGADNYAFMVLTAAMTDRPLLEGRMLGMLRTEERVTARVDRLADDYSFSRQTWRREPFDLDATIFDSAEYVKDGLLTITEWMGPSPWSVRMIGLMDDIWKHAAVDTPFGKIPTLNFEVNGDLLQGCSRLYWFTGDPKYLDWAIRLGDYYLLGDHHPTRDLDDLRLSDHGCEVVNGLSELYVAVSHVRPVKKAAYREPLQALYDAILEHGRNADGLLYQTINAKAGTHSSALCDTWGYNYDGIYTAFVVDGAERYRDAVRHVLARLGPKYHGRPWGDKSQDGIADSIEGALNLYNREPVDAASAWIDHQTRVLWDCQRADGVIEAWHGDGNFARTTLMYALWKTQGITIEPWRADVCFGAVREGDRLHLLLTSRAPWHGAVKFDRPRHRDLFRLPVDYPRINQFPEWFTAAAGQAYRVRLGAGAAPQIRTGEALIAGESCALPGDGAVVWWTIETRAK